MEGVAGIFEAASIQKLQHNRSESCKVSGSDCQACQASIANHHVHSAPEDTDAASLRHLGLHCVALRHLRSRVARARCSFHLFSKIERKGAWQDRTGMKTLTTRASRGSM